MQALAQAIDEIENRDGEGDCVQRLAVVMALCASRLAQYGEKVAIIGGIAKHGAAHGYYLSRDLPADVLGFLTPPLFAPPERPPECLVDELGAVLPGQLVDLGVDLRHGRVGVAEQLGDLVEG